MISITCLTGEVILEELPTSDLIKLESRVSRTPTLDGGVTLIHSGFSHGDRTLYINALAGLEESETIASIIENETIVTLSSRLGLFSGVIQNFNFDGNEVSINYMVKEKLA